MTDTSAYDEGFADGLRWVATRLREAATQVETPVRADYSSNGGTKTIKAFKHVGDLSFARKLRDVAQLIEQVTEGIMTDE